MPNGDRGALRPKLGLGGQAMGCCPKRWDHGITNGVARAARGLPSTDGRFAEPQRGRKSSAMNYRGRHNRQGSTEE